MIEHLPDPVRTLRQQNQDLFRTLAAVLRKVGPVQLDVHERDIVDWSIVADDIPTGEIILRAFKVGSGTKPAAAGDVGKHSTTSSHACKTN